MADVLTTSTLVQPAQPDQLDQPDELAVIDELRQPSWADHGSNV